ncbi:LytTR family DNA-binding domain-containing protein [Clostridium sp. JN-9]|uniref:LytR/AlgR family response regulator transcription factor n=1 Tax=Clostridium sp. JN-9 TaxID=2507159 RepID=UPI000FFDF973|nr:LytTR family DNA-binding domain-containing protein [Clostridium sp. JN-9]QAT39626.1 response regulator transcription factor [Clostridium sp. JN-9]
MLKVIICEDNSVHRNNLKKLIENIILREGLNLKICLCTGEPQEVMDYVDKNDMTGIYFLDVDLKSDINGIKLGSRIREKDTEGFIIFTTTHLEMSCFAFKYKVEAMDYVIKDDDDFKERVAGCLIKAYNTYYKGNHNEDYISIHTDERVINVKPSDILFVETTGMAHKIKVHEENRQIEFYGNLKDIYEMLPKNFYRCHKSYIVNKDKISEINRKTKTIIMTNGEECYVSFKFMKGLLA